MQSRITLTLALGLMCLAASVQGAAPEKDVLTEHFRLVVMVAHTVAIVEVTGARVVQMGKGIPTTWAETVQFKNPVLLYGKAVPASPAVYQYYGNAKPGAKPGAKVIVAWTKDGAALVPHSAATVLATRRALAPGWSVAPGLMCPACMKLAHTDDIGKCETCAGQTASGMYKLCAKCGPLAGQCQACKRSIGPATPHVELMLKNRNPFSRGRPRPSVRAKLMPGETPTLWVGVRGRYVRNIPPVTELPCIAGELATCKNLIFLVQGPGIVGVEVVAFHMKIPKGKARYTPLRAASAAPLKLRVLPNGKAFKTPGVYTVRAAAGRLTSNTYPVTIHAPPTPTVPPTHRLRP